MLRPSIPRDTEHPARDGHPHPEQSRHPQGALGPEPRAQQQQGERDRAEPDPHRQDHWRPIHPRFHRRSPIPHRFLHAVTSGMEMIMERMKPHTAPPQMATGGASPIHRASDRKASAETMESPVAPRARPEPLPPSAQVMPVP